VKEFLSQRGVGYRELDVSRDMVAAEEMVRLTGQRVVPVTVIDGRAIVGYDVPRLEEALRSAARPRLGAAIADAASMAARGRTSVARGAYVGRVNPGGAAEAAGLVAGDVITAVAGRPVTSADDLEALLQRVVPGRDVSVTYVRDGVERTTTARL